MCFHHFNNELKRYFKITVMITFRGRQMEVVVLDQGEVKRGL